MSDAPKKTRSPVERIIVWGLIGLMLLVVGIEYRAKTNYDKAFGILAELGTPTLGELKTKISGATIGEPNSIEKFKMTEVPFKFFSIFKDYRMVAQVPGLVDDTPALDDRKVSEFYTPEALADEQDKAQIIPASIPEGGAALPSDPAGGGMGGGGGGGRRRARPESDDEHSDGSEGEDAGSSDEAGETEAADTSADADAGEETDAGEESDDGKEADGGDDQ
ncbi:hypothetical protein OAH18_00990 [bacterium]|nr:hypothetical protein [bacterium]